MNNGRVPPRCNFLQFADVTVDVAEELYGDDAAKIVRSAWNEVESCARITRTEGCRSVLPGGPREGFNRPCQTVRLAVGSSGILHGMLR